MNTYVKYATLLFAGSFALASCKNDDDPVAPAPIPVNEEELITTFTLHFHSVGGVEHKHFGFTDLDGDGGDPPVIEADTLSVDSIYAVEIDMLNQSTTPTVDITAEIESEGTAHQFFFQPAGANALVDYSDADANGLPIGLESIWTIGSAGNGTMTVTLRHGPDKTASGVSTGDITNAGGETDIEVIFPLAIE